MRNKILLDRDWRFVKQAAGLKEAVAAAKITGEPVTLPHTWNAVDGQDGGNDYYRGTCWYVRSLEVSPMDGREVWLEFNGAAMTVDVYFNGVHVAHHEGGYSTFRANITELVGGGNVLAVSVDNSENHRVYPQKADFTFYGGLYREVYMIVVPRAHFALGYAGGSGIRVTPRVQLPGAAVTGWSGGEGMPAQPGAGTDVTSRSEGEGASARPAAVVDVEAWVEGPAEQVYFELDGQKKSAPVVEGCARCRFELSDVHLWNGVEDPYMYTVTACLGEDEITARFGCRTLGFDPEKGFFLNGRSYPLRGVARHQDRAGVGNALTALMHREDMALIREIGANTIRLAHYQHSQYFYDLCDEHGMLVWAEIPYITQHMPECRENTLSQMRELVVQNYNHPSIMCWGLSNEITASGGVTEDLLENHRLLNDLCHSLDQTRPTTMAHVFMLGTDSPLISIPDLGSYNLYFGWYLGELSQNDQFFDDYHRTYPNRCIGFSEYGADANPAFQNDTPESGDYSEAYQALYHEHLLHMIEERPYLWATHVWNMFDFAADGRDEGGAHGVNQKGLVTMDRQVKKDAFYLYKAHWSREPFVHLCGRRYRERAEAVTEIKVYTNAPQVELYVDGVLFAAQGGKPELRFRVPLSGQHRIEAIAGQCRDEMCILRVDAPNPSYIYGSKGGVTNWFDKEDFRPGYFSVKDTMAQLQAHDKAGAIVGRMMDMASASRGDVAQSVKGNPDLQRMMGAMTLESLLKKAGEAVTPEQVRALNQALQQIPKPEA